ncbi:MAG: winged helix-turn-helix transcriptional regulator [Desulfovibrionaceae bacterium]|nr:winged helix-turn-helix transcriptional regulator [Desulfovibrionaceae bacterium]
MPDRQPVKPMEAAFLAQVCKALSHPARIRILIHLLNREQSTCGDIVALLPLAQSTVSQHLNVLKAAGLVTGEAAGRETRYRADRALLARFGGFLRSMLGDGERRCRKDRQPSPL